MSMYEFVIGTVEPAELNGILAGGSVNEVSNTKDVAQLSGKDIVIPST